MSQSLDDLMELAFENGIESIEFTKARCYTKAEVCTVGFDLSDESVCSGKSFCRASANSKLDALEQAIFLFQRQSPVKKVGNVAGMDIFLDKRLAADEIYLRSPKKDEV